MSDHIPLTRRVKYFHEYSLDITGRVIYFTGAIEEDEVSVIITQIHLLNSINLNPIYMVINSMGGSDDMMFALYDAITLSQSKVVTIGTGMICSAATLILVGGDERYATENCWFMAHKGRIVSEGDEDELTSQAEFTAKSSDRYWKVLGRHTSRAASTWYEKSRDRGGLWLDTEQMLKCGVIDGVITSDRRPLESLPKRRIKRLLKDFEEDED